MIWQKYSKVSKAKSSPPSDSIAIQTKILIRLPTQLPKSLRFLLQEQSTGTRHLSRHSATTRFRGQTKQGRRRYSGGFPPPAGKLTGYNPPRISRSIAKL
ncbi:hypothetical protein Q3G72_004100 [Acer saccharum]|nr:hypothetical protein Q3G72_004100 [Acer saccharum]